jgi:hypothetical protein
LLVFIVAKAFLRMSEHVAVCCPYQDQFVLHSSLPMPIVYFMVYQSPGVPSALVPALLFVSSVHVSFVVSGACIMLQIVFPFSAGVLWIWAGVVVRAPSRAMLWWLVLAMMIACCAY